MTSHFAKDVGVDRRTLTCRHQQKQPSQHTVKYKDRRSLVIEFLKRPEFSITLPGEKDTVTIKKKKHQKVILREFLHILHRLYNAENPEKLVSIYFFCKVRREERYIKPLKYMDTNQCLCVRHQNYVLKLRAVRISNLPVVPDTLIRNYTVETLREKLESAELPEQIVYKNWQWVDLPYGQPGNIKYTKKLRLVEVRMPKEEFIANLIEEFPGIQTHAERAFVQHAALRTLRQHLSPNECTVQMDFSENWVISYPEEPQSAYFSKEPVTLHPTVIHYLDTASNTICHSSLAIATDDRKHDSGAVLAFIKVIAEHIKEKLPAVKIVHYASDGPSSQYKNIKIFSVVCKHLDLFGLLASWLFFESAHSKGPCDGVGAVAKRMADYCVKRNILIENAADVVLQGNSSQGEIQYVYVPVEQVLQACAELADIAAPKSLPGTMDIHAFVLVCSGRSIAVRETSCYQNCCWNEGKWLRSGCQGWKEVDLFAIDGTECQEAQEVLDDAAAPLDDAASPLNNAPALLDDAPTQVNERTTIG